MTFKNCQLSDLQRIFGGAEGNRTLDLLNAIQALSQLSYGPTTRLKYEDEVETDCNIQINRTKVNVPPLGLPNCRERSKLL